MEPFHIYIPPFFFFSRTLFSSGAIWGMMVSTYGSTLSPNFFRKVPRQVAT